MPIIGAAHVDSPRRTDPVMYIKEDEYAANAIIFGRTPSFDTPDDATKWQLKLVSYENGIIVTRFADGGKYNQKWSEREAAFSSILPIVGPGFPPDQTISGEVIIGGLKLGGRVSEVTLPAGVWTALPASPLPERNAISVQNTSASEIVLNYDYTAPLPAGYQGVKLAAGNERYYDITDTITLYAKPLAGPVTITVEELS